MIDPLEESQIMTKPPSWDEKVDSVMKGVYRQANIYFGLGLGLYGGGSLLLMVLLRNNPMLLTLVVMFFFQLCVMFFGTKAIFPCISGAFKVGLLANRETVPVFEEMKEKLSNADRRMEQAALDIRKVGDNIHGEVKRLADSMERPIQTPRRVLVGPSIPVESVDGGNGKGTRQDQ